MPKVLSVLILLRNLKILAKKPQECGFLRSEAENLRSDGSIKSPLLHHPKHVTHILHHDPGDRADSVDVVFGMIGEVDACHEI